MEKEQEENKEENFLEENEEIMSKEEEAKLKEKLKALGYL